jgi:hypothetical protein
MVNNGKRSNINDQTQNYNPNGDKFYTVVSRPHDQWITENSIQIENISDLVERQPE